MEGYKAVVARASKELNTKERISIKDTSDAIKLDDLLKETESIVINVDYYALIQIHNEKSDTKDYTKIVIADKSGEKYTTGSMPFITTFEDIIEEMNDAGETDISLKVYAKESKNYKGKYFLTCSII